MRVTAAIVRERATDLDDGKLIRGVIVHET